ncbi:hypothetical protein BC941DRAFT_22205 [Chlamydoabsidia padenii]|nr:hypothetical protein BC941DRAFT_22205 [Chlamydoabsidia padenii]
MHSNTMIFDFHIPGCKRSSMLLTHVFKSRRSLAGSRHTYSLLRICLFFSSFFLSFQHPETCTLIMPPFVCQQCKQPLRFDDSLTDLDEASADLLLGKVSNNCEVTLFDGIPL